MDETGSKNPTTRISSHISSNSDKYAYLLLLSLTVLFFHDFILGSKYLALRDTFAFLYPWRALTTDAISNGSIPLWNPYTLCGSYFMGNPGTSLFYPLNIIYYIFPDASGIHAWIFVHFFFAGAGFYTLLRYFKISTVACIIGTLAYTFNGWGLGRLEFLNPFYFTWTPWVLLFTLKSINGKRPLLFSLLNTLCIASELHGTGPIELFYTLLTVAPFYLFYGYREYREEGKLLALAYLPASLFIGFLLYAVQLLPTLELVSLSDRVGKMSYEFSTLGSLHPSKIIQILMPYFWGRPHFTEFWGYDWHEHWVGNFYCGIPTLILGAYAIYCAYNNENQISFRPLIIISSALLLISLLTALGKFNPLYRFAYDYLPMFNRFRWPSMFLSITVMSFAALSAAGAHMILNNLKRGESLKIFLIALAPFALLLIFGIIMLNTFFYESIINLSISNALQTWGDKFDPDIIGIRSESLRLLLFLCGSIFVIYLVSYKKNAHQLFAVLCICILTIDLFQFSRPLISTTEVNIYTLQSKQDNRILSDNEIFRISKISNIDDLNMQLYGSKNVGHFKKAREAYIEDSRLPEKAYTVEGAGPLKIRDYKRVLANAKFGPFSEEIKKKIFNLLNVKYFVLAQQFGGNGLDNIDVGLIESKNYLPRAFMVSQARTYSNSEGVFNYMFSEAFNPKGEVLLTEELPMGFIQDSFSYSIKGLEYDYNSVILNVNNSNNGILVLSDSYFPGWKAYIDDTETKIYKANYFMRAIAVPGGNHTVEFRFEPQSFYLGSAISGTTLIAAISMLLFTLFRRKTSPPNSP